MKTYTTLLNLAIFFFLTSCYSDTAIGPEGPRGAQGPQGPQGEPGESGFVFEWEGINFTSPDYAAVLTYPNNFDVYDSDVALVYLLWDSYLNDDNERIDLWRPLSQTLMIDEGTLIYDYDFTKYDVRLYMKADFPLSDLGADHTDDWVARVVVVPGNFWNSGRVDFSDYNAVKEALGLPELDSPTQRYSRPQ